MKKNPRKISLIGSRATSMLSVALVLIVIGLCGLLGIAIHRASSAVSAGTTILVTFQPGEDPLYISGIKRNFNDAPWVDRYEFADANTVLSRESEAMDENGRLALELLSENPYGDEFTIYIADGYRSTDSLTAITERLYAIDGVDIVAGNAAAIGATNDGLERLLFYLLILAAALLAISVALISNTISLAIYSRRFTINTMKLVGATASFIRRPFVRAGMLTGAVAGVLAAAVVCGIEAYILLYEPVVGPYITWSDIAVTGGILFLLGTFIARGAAWWSASRYLHKNYDQLFKK